MNLDAQTVADAGTIVREILDRTKGRGQLQFAVATSLLLSLLRGQGLKNIDAAWKDFKTEMDHFQIQKLKEKLRSTQ